MSRQNIETSIHFIPLHLHLYYRDKFGYNPADFPNASSAFERIVSLPIYPKMTDGNLRDVIGAVRKLIQEYRR